MLGLQFELQHMSHQKGSQDKAVDARCLSIIASGRRGSRVPLQTQAQGRHVHNFLVAGISICNRFSPLDQKLGTSGVWNVCTRGSQMRALTSSTSAMACSPASFSAKGSMMRACGWPLRVSNARSAVPGAGKSRGRCADPQKYLHQLTCIA